MKAFSALTSVLPTAAFHATADGEIIDTNAPFVQLMRCVPGDDWRLNVQGADRALVDTFWDGLFTNTVELHQPMAFTLNGSNDVYQVRAQAVTEGEDGGATAVGVIMVETATQKHRWETDPVTGLPEHNAVLEKFSELRSQDRAFVAAVVLLDLAGEDFEVSRKEAARQLLSVIRPSDMLASEADGRFLLCASGINSPKAALALAERMVESLKDSSLTGRVGLALPSHDEQHAPATLVREAEAGAYASDLGSFGFAPADA